MKNLVRLILFYSVPVLVAFCLFSLTWPMRIELSQLSGEILQYSTSSDGFDIRSFLGKVEDPEYVRIQQFLYWLQVAYIVLSMALGALLVPKELDSKRSGDVAIAIALGIVTSKVAVGYPFLEWNELWGWIAGGLMCFFLVVVLRLRRRQKG